VWIDGGSIRQDGPTHEVVSAYESAMARGDSNIHSQVRREGTRARFVRWEIDEPRGDNPHMLTEIESTTIRFTIEVNEVIHKGHHGIALYDQDRQLIWAYSEENVHLSPGTHHLSHTFPMLPLRPGPYSWLVSLYEDGDMIDFWEGVPGMVVATESHQHRDDRWNGILNVPSRFELDGKAGCD